MKTISTKYYGATNTKPSRIKATDGDNTIWYTCDWNHEGYNHINAARILKEKLRWTGKMVGGHTKEGMVFVFVDESPVI